MNFDRWPITSSTVGAIAHAKKKNSHNTWNESNLIYLTIINQHRTHSSKCQNQTLIKSLHNTSVDMWSNFTSDLLKLTIYKFWVCVQSRGAKFSQTPHHYLNLKIGWGFLCPAVWGFLNLLLENLELWTAYLQTHKPWESFAMKLIKVLLRNPASSQPWAMCQGSIPAQNLSSFQIRTGSNVWNPTLPGLDSLGNWLNCLQTQFLLHLGEKNESGSFCISETQSLHQQWG